MAGPQAGPRAGAPRPAAGSAAQPNFAQQNRQRIKSMQAIVKARDADAADQAAAEKFKMTRFQDVPGRLHSDTRSTPVPSINSGNGNSNSSHGASSAAGGNAPRASGSSVAAAAAARRSAATAAAAAAAGPHTRVGVNKAPLPSKAELSAQSRERELCCQEHRGRHHELAVQLQELPQRLRPGHGARGTLR